MLRLLVREEADWIPPPSPPLDEILYVTIIGVAIKTFKTSTIFLRLKSHFDFQLPGCFIQIIFRSSTLLLFKLSVVCHFQLGGPGLLFECRGQTSRILHNTLIPYSIPYSVPYSVPFRIPHFTRYPFQLKLPGPADNLLDMKHYNNHFNTTLPSMFPFL